MSDTPEDILDLRPIVFHLTGEQLAALRLALRRFGHSRRHPGSRSAALNNLVRAALGANAPIPTDEPFGQ